MGFGLPLMLLGLAGVAIPILIHLVNRRRYDIVDWGAMQFLKLSERIRRRMLIEEILLMLLRMALIAGLVLALAGPYADSPALAKLGMRVNQDVVLLFDGSLSMAYAGSGQAAHDRAKDWANAFLNRLTAGDGVSVLQAKQQVVPVLNELCHDRERVREAIARLPTPSGGCDWPQAVQQAFKILADSGRPQQEILILTDGQRFGWADENTLVRWELLGKLREQQRISPRIRVIRLDPKRPANPRNWSLAPLHASRAVASAGQHVTFRTSLQIYGQEEYRKPHRLRLEVDGQPVRNLEAPAEARLEKGQVPVSFRHRFGTPGSHLVSAIVEPDPPPDERLPSYVLKDQLPGDNRQDLAIDIVPTLPVLLVDGDTRGAGRKRGSHFLRDALAPARDPAPVVLARVVAFDEFDPTLLSSGLSKDPETRPRVLILCNVPRLLARQQEGVAQFLANGGGVLVTLGERVDGRYYNAQLYRGGEGWLPGRLEEIAGDESRPEQAISALPSSFFHPALDLFREATVGGLGEARFPRWWKIAVPRRNTASVPIALLANGDPLFVERTYQKGRIILSAVPLDNSWRTNLTDLSGFAPLAHELTYYLADARASIHNLQPGQPLLHRLKPEETPSTLVLQPPEGDAKPLVYDQRPAEGGYVARLVHSADGPALVYDDTLETGVYRITARGGRTVYYVVQPDPRESDLASCTDAEREKVAQLVPMTYEDGTEVIAGAMPDIAPKQELWWWFLLGVIVLLYSELWLTRRIVKGR